MAEWTDNTEESIFIFLSASLQSNHLLRASSQVREARQLIRDYVAAMQPRGLLGGCSQWSEETHFCAHHNPTVPHSDWPFTVWALSFSAVMITARIAAGSTTHPSLEGSVSKSYNRAPLSRGRVQFGAAALHATAKIGSVVYEKCKAICSTLSLKHNRQDSKNKTTCAIYFYLSWLSRCQLLLCDTELLSPLSLINGIINNTSRYNTMSGKWVVLPLSSFWVFSGATIFGN